MSSFVSGDIALPSSNRPSAPVCACSIKGTPCVAAGGRPPGSVPVSGSQGRKWPMLSPSITADTDDRVLIETNVPISRFIPHSRRRSLYLSVLSLTFSPFFLSLPSCCGIFSSLPNGQTRSARARHVPRLNCLVRKIPRMKLK